jgi:MtN3 and saliva related transmembrane protein
MLSATDFIGSAAAFCTTVAFVPQIVHIVKTRNTNGISLTMYSIFTLGVVLWLAYGLILHSFPIILANVVTLVLAGSVLAMKVKDVYLKNKND